MSAACGFDCEKVGKLLLLLLPHSASACCAHFNCGRRTPNINTESGSNMF
jgi:hypothetical protein